MRSTPDVEFPEPGATDRLLQNVEYNISLVSVDIAGHTEMLRELGLEKLEVVIERVRKILHESMAEYSGNNWAWAGDGGLWAFWGEDRCERAALAGIKILSELVVFNLDQRRNVSGQPIHLRISAGDGKLRYRERTAVITSLFLNDIVKLQEKRVRTGEMLVTEPLFFRLNPGLQREFQQLRQGFHGTTLFRYQRIKTKRRLRDSDIDEIVRKLSSNVTDVIFRFETYKDSTPPTEVISTLHDNVRDCYSTLDFFLRRFDEANDREGVEEIGLNWSPKYARFLERQISSLVTLEDALYQELRKQLTWLDSPTHAEVFDAQEGLTDFVISSHTRLSIRLLRLQTLVSRRIGRATEVSSLQEAATRLINSDEFDRIPAFSRIVSFPDQELSQFILNAPDSNNKTLFLEALWGLADVVLSEYALEPKNGDNSLAVWNSLQAEPRLGPRFRALRTLLEDSSPIEDDFLYRKFRNSEYEPRIADKQMIWRAVVIGHQNINNRYSAAGSAPLSALWQTVAYQSSPLLSLWIVAQRLTEKESDNVKKIFFDCIKPRLTNLLSYESDLRTLETVGELLRLFFSFDFFMEDPYFQDLRALLSLYTSRLYRTKNSDDRFEEDRRYIMLRDQTRLPKAIIPDGIDKVSVPVQRHLAANGAYLEKFVCHPDSRIASETIRYISSEETIEKIVEYAKEAGQSMNASVLENLPPHLQRHYKERRSEKRRRRHRGHINIEGKLPQEDIERIKGQLKR